MHITTNPMADAERHFDALDAREAAHDERTADWVKHSGTPEDFQDFAESSSWQEAVQIVFDLVRGKPTDELVNRAKAVLGSVGYDATEAK